MKRFKAVSYITFLTILLIASFIVIRLRASEKEIEIFPHMFYDKSVWQKMTPEQQKEVLQTLFRSIYVDNPVTAKAAYKLAEEHAREMAKELIRTMPHPEATISNASQAAVSKDDDNYIRTAFKQIKAEEIHRLQLWKTQAPDAYNQEWEFLRTLNINSDKDLAEVQLGVPLRYFESNPNGDPNKLIGDDREMDYPLEIHRQQVAWVKVRKTDGKWEAASAGGDAVGYLNLDRKKAAQISGKPIDSLFMVFSKEGGTYGWYEGNTLMLLPLKPGDAPIGWQPGQVLSAEKARKLMKNFPANSFVKN